MPFGLVRIYKTMTWEGMVIRGKGGLLASSFASFPTFYITPKWA